MLQQTQLLLNSDHEFLQNSKLLCHSLQKWRPTNAIGILSIASIASGRKWLKDFTCFLWGCCWNSGVDCSWPSSPCHNGPAFSDRFNRFWVSGQGQWVMCMFQNWMAFCQFNHCLESTKLRSVRDSDPNPGWCCSCQRWGRQRRHIAMMLRPPNHNCSHVFTIQWNKTMTIQWQ